MITPSSHDSAAAVFFATISSVSPRYTRRSEWPTMTHWHRPWIIAGDTSPVYAPFISQKQSCAPSFTPDPSSTSDTPTSQGNGGMIATSMLEAWPRATERIPRARSSASSRLVGFIFQFAATSGIPGGLDIFQDGNAGKCLALEVLEGGASAGGDPREAAVQSQRFDGGDRVTPTDQRVCPAPGDGPAERLGAVAEVLDLGDSHRAVPDHRAGGPQSLTKQRNCFRTDIQRHPPSFYGVGPHDAKRLAGFHLPRAHQVERQHQLVSRLFGHG